jgi:hypothetical protein
LCVVGFKAPLSFSATDGERAKPLQSVNLS